MSDFKIVKAKKKGTIALSEGVTHFNPKSDRDGGRYRGGVFPTDDAIKAEKKGLVEIVGDATEGDWQKYKADNLANHGLAAPSKSSTKEFAKEGAAPKAEKSEDENLPDMLKLSIKKMREELPKISDMAELQALYTAERARGEAARPSALDEIERRANQLDNEAFTTFKEDLDKPAHDPDAPPA